MSVEINRAKFTHGHGQGHGHVSEIRRPCVCVSVQFMWDFGMLMLIWSDFRCGHTQLIYCPKSPIYYWKKTLPQSQLCKSFFFQIAPQLQFHKKQEQFFLNFKSATWTWGRYFAIFFKYYNDIEQPGSLFTT